MVAATFRNQTSGGQTNYIYITCGTYTIQEKGHGASSLPLQQHSLSCGRIVFWNMSHSNVRKKERFHNARMVLLVAFVLEMLQLPHVHHVSLKPLLGIDKIMTALAPCSRLVLHGSSQDGTKAFAVVSWKQGIAMVCVCVCVTSAAAYRS